MRNIVVNYLYFAIPLFEQFSGVFFSLNFGLFMSYFD